MRIVIQRVKEASVHIDHQSYAKIGQGLLLLVGFEDGDQEETMIRMAKKCCEIRIFEDEKQKMNLSLQEIDGEILSISQFTLYADCRKGRRPSFTMAAKPLYANELYEKFNEELKQRIHKVKTGVFGSDMKVSLVNDGPVTILLDSEDC